MNVMAAYHRLTLTIAGETVHGIAFSSEAELEQFLGGRCLQVQTSAPTPAAQVEVSDETRAPGRPSFNEAISQAAKALTLDPSDSWASRANQVLRHLSKTRSPTDELPSQRCVINFLAGRSVGKNGGIKYGKNKTRAKLLRTAGGI
jgi:hypothetical protein